MIHDQIKATAMYFTRPNCESRNRQTPIFFFWIEIHRIRYFIHSQSLRTVEEKMTKEEEISSVVENPRFSFWQHIWLCLSTLRQGIASLRSQIHDIILIVIR